MQDFILVAAIILVIILIAVLIIQQIKVKSVLQSTQKDYLHAGRGFRGGVGYLVANQSPTGWFCAHIGTLYGGHCSLLYTHTTAPTARNEGYGRPHRGLQKGRSHQQRAAYPHKRANKIKYILF